MGGLLQTIQFVFGVFGNVASLFLFLVPTYGLPFITADNILVTTINGAGAAIELTYVLIFFIYAPNREKRKIFTILDLVFVAFGAATVVSIVVFHGKKRKLFCGMAATIFLIVMYASPLSVIISTGVGLILGVMQLMLYFIYREKKTSTAADKA